MSRTIKITEQQLSEAFDTGGIKTYDSKGSSSDFPMGHELIGLGTKGANITTDDVSDSLSSQNYYRNCIANSFGRHIMPDE